MGVESNSSDVWRGQAIGPFNFQFSESATAETIAARDVLRCGHCSLVQFRTSSSLCRRCAKPLPPLYPVLVEEAVKTEPAAEPSASYEEEIANLDRGARNRRLPVGCRLKAIREQRGLTQMEMATLLEIPRSYLSRIENNRLLPGPLMVARFAEALDMEISSLLPEAGGKNQELPPAAEAPEAALLRLCARLPLEHQAAVVLRARRMLGIIPRPAVAEQPPAARQLSPAARRSAPQLHLRARRIPAHSTVPAVHSGARR